MSIIVSLSLLVSQSLSSSSHWDYDHMSDWSHEFSMCAASDESPIDIKGLDAVIDASVCGANLDWDIDFTKQMFKIANNGHSITLKPIAPTNIDPDMDLAESLQDHDGNKYISLALNDNTIARFPNYFAEGTKHQTYCLDSLHFHWGTNDVTGSEHLVNGYQYPLEIHFVHYSCDHSSLGATLEEFPTKESVENGNNDGIDTHRLGVIGIFFDVVEDKINPAFETILENKTLHQIIYPSDRDHIHDEAEIINGLDLSQIIPDHVQTEGYYAYKGSLTTPPCTNIVNWHVMNARGYIGKSQMEKFRELMSTETHSIAPNYREVQENINTVYSCVDEKIQKVFVEPKGQLSLVVVAVIACLSTTVIFGAISFLIYKKCKRSLIEEINGNGNAKPRTDRVNTVSEAVSYV